MKTHLRTSRKISLFLLALAVSHFAIGCSGSDSKDTTVGGGGAEFDPTLYYTKTDIDTNFASKTYTNNIVSPGGSLTGTITGVKSLYDTHTSYATSGCQPDVWSTTANIVLAIVMPSDPTKPPSSDVTIKGGTSETNNQAYLFPANFKGAQVYIFPRDVSGSGNFRVWASSWATNTNTTVFSIYTISFTSQY